MSSNIPEGDRLPGLSDSSGLLVSVVLLLTLVPFYRQNRARNANDATISLGPMVTGGMEGRWTYVDGARAKRAELLRRKLSPAAEECFITCPWKPRRVPREGSRGNNLVFLAFSCKRIISWVWGRKTPFEKFLLLSCIGT